MEYPKHFGIIRSIQEGYLPDGCTPKLRVKIRQLAKKYEEHDGILYLKMDKGLGPQLLHEGNVDEILKGVHQEGHLGMQNSWRKARLQYVAPGMYERMKQSMQSCPICQTRSRGRHLRQNPAAYRPQVNGLCEQIN